MTLSLLVSCDGEWPGDPTMPCRAWLTLRTVAPAEALALARADGWSRDRDAHDLCPAHTRLAEEDG